jgi:hypothetical protein
MIEASLSSRFVSRDGRDTCSGYDSLPCAPRYLLPIARNDWEGDAETGAGAASRCPAQAHARTFTYNSGHKLSHYSRSVN